MVKAASYHGTICSLMSAHGTGSRWALCHIGDEIHFLRVVPRQQQAESYGAPPVSRCTVFEMSSRLQVAYWMVHAQ